MRCPSRPDGIDNMGDLAGGTNGYINTWMVIGLTSHFYIRKYRAGWFRKYNVRIVSESPF